MAYFDFKKLITTKDRNFSFIEFTVDVELIVKHFIIPNVQKSFNVPGFVAYCKGARINSRV